MFKNKTILLVGGTGTVAKKLIFKLNNCKEIIIFSRDERKQFSMEFEEFLDYNNISYVLGDIRDKNQLNNTMNNCDIVFHLAALKHVKLGEYNPHEAIKTNVLGTQNIIECAIHHGVEKVIYTSTDKAANPSNVMGITKLLAERLVSSAQCYCVKHDLKTIFTSVRFGNITGSRGSVVPLWITQISRGGLITLTDPSMSRFIIKKSEAIRLILKSADIARGGEIFLFKMPSVNIKELAEAVIEEYSEGRKINLNIVGARDGEKMYEEIMTEEEKTRAYELEDMYIILPQIRELRGCLANYYTSIGAQKVDSMYLNSTNNVESVTKNEIKKMLREDRLIREKDD